MPELPEVETMVKRLHEHVGERIKDVSVDTKISAKAGKKYLPGDEYNAVIGEAITGAYRRGKFIVLTTSTGALLCHNAMSGYWDSAEEPWTFDYVEGARKAGESDVRVKLKLESGKTLRFHDARMFGSLRFVDPQALAKKLSELGLDADHTVFLYEPSKVIDAEDFYRICEIGKPIKEVLLDQSRIAGVGNIYAAEACWFARISPHRIASGLTKEERFKLWLMVRSVIRQALERRLDYNGLSIYRKKMCRVYKGSVKMDKIKGRSTYWCPTCQK